MDRRSRPPAPSAARGATPSAARGQQSPAWAYKSSRLGWVERSQRNPTSLLMASYLVSMQTDAIFFFRNRKVTVMEVIFITCANDNLNLKLQIFSPIDNIIDIYMHYAFGDRIPWKIRHA
jgi:hypothetical protein